ncbi:MAG: cytochrome c oxidase subunit II [Acidobacteria bacterium]|nr:cytochrome c oxidase subunit II [Acidobacteriota bacterium]
MFDNFPLWPTAASSHAVTEDWVYIFLVVLSAVMSLLIFLTIVVFGMKYRRRHGREAQQIEGSTILEVAWTVAPLGVFLGIFAWGAVLYFDERTPPAGAAEIYVVGKQWMWKLQHMEGVREINQLHIPVDRDIKLIMTSQDVIHSFFIPEFRVKQDVLPGRYTTLWFHATKPGIYHLFCAQFCGTQHSGMIGEVVVMNASEYQAWLTGGAPVGSLAQDGQTMFLQLGCQTCHRFDVQGRGPNLVGIFGKPVQLEDGRVVTADENYIRQHILTPGRTIVSGFRNIMPSWQGQITEEQLNSLVAYIKSLNPPPAGAAGVPNP